MSFACMSGLVAEHLPVDEEPHVALDRLRVLKRKASDEVSVDVGHFRRGDHVTVIRKMSWHIPLAQAENYRRNIVEGTSGTIEGFEDEEGVKVLLKVCVDIPKKGITEVARAVYPRNLQLTQNYELQKKAKDITSAEPPGPSAEQSVDAMHEWLMMQSMPHEVKVQSRWSSLVADADALARTFWLRSSVGMCLKALHKSLPSFSEADLLVCHRQNSKGAWRCEVWTQRPFAAHEILLAPFSSQIKDTHLTTAGHAVLGIPACGSGAHPEGNVLALDGRGKASMAAAGTIDERDHYGSLYWLISRTSQKSEATLSFEPVTWSATVDLKLPFKKNRVSVKEDSMDLPTLPLLTNKKALKEHTCLKVWHTDEKPEKKEKPHQN